MPTSNEVTIALDAMGGDFAPDSNIQGALGALSETTQLKILLVGDRSILLPKLQSLGVTESDCLAIVHADETISMSETASSVVRKKKNSSVHVGLRLVHDSLAGAFLSAGNSGAVMATAATILKRLPGVERPAIVVKLPTAEGFVILLDAGANVDCKADHLVQFSKMGDVYAKVVEGLKSPRIGVLSNASETNKGNELTREVHQRLEKDESINYVGYVEGFDLFQGIAEVLVCDGFVGNLVLKVIEGAADTSFKWFRKELKTNLVGIAGVLLLKKTLRKFKGKFDYQPYGAAPLLGLNGMVLVSHGGSSKLAIKNGILTAKRAVEQAFIARVGAYLGETQERAEG